MPLSRDAQLEVHLLQAAAELGCTGLCTRCRCTAAIHSPSHIGRRKIHGELQSRCSWVRIDQLQLKCCLLALQQAWRRCHAEVVAREEIHLPLVSPAWHLPLSDRSLHDRCTEQTQQRLCSLLADLLEELQDVTDVQLDKLVAQL